MQNIGNERRQEPKILKKKNSKTHGRYVGEFQPQKRDSYYIKIFFLKKSTIPSGTRHCGQDNFGKFFFKCNIAIKHFEQYIMNVTYE